MNEASGKLLQLRPVLTATNKPMTAARILGIRPDCRGSRQGLPRFGGLRRGRQHRDRAIPKATPMLLNEFQKQAIIITQQQDEIAALKSQVKEITGLRQQVSALQSQVSNLSALSARLARLEAQQVVALDR